jgi:CRISPR-associated protein Csm2
MPPTPEDLRKIITQADAAELTVRTAETLGKQLAEAKLTTSQIRAVFGEVRQIEGMWSSSMDDKTKQQAKRRLILLKPKMAYRARKEQGRGVEQLVGVLSPAVDLVNNDDANFARFVEFFEAILAYHKANGGK